MKWLVWLIAAAAVMWTALLPGNRVLSFAAGLVALVLALIAGIESQETTE